jgi:hypothetical protein
MLVAYCMGTERVANIAEPRGGESGSSVSSELKGTGIGRAG